MIIHLFTYNFYGSSWMTSVWISDFGLRRQPSPFPAACRPSVSTHKMLYLPCQAPQRACHFGWLPNAPGQSVLCASFFWERSCVWAWPWLTEVTWSLDQPSGDCETGSQRTWISGVPPRFSRSVEIFRKSGKPWGFPTRHTHTQKSLLEERKRTFFFFFLFETGSPLAQAGLELVSSQGWFWTPSSPTFQVLVLQACTIKPHSLYVS